MNATQFIDYLEKPSSISEASTKELAALVDQFPYFQSAHLLYLKGLHQNKSLEYPRQLKVAAAYASDRKKLYELIIQEDLHKQIRLVEEYSSEEPVNVKTDVSPLEAQILTEAVSASIKLEVSQQRESPGKKVPAIPSDQFRRTGMTNIDQLREPEKPDLPSIKKPIVKTTDEKSVRIDEKRTFGEWLKVSAEPAQETETAETPTEQVGLIDKFIGTSPRIGDLTTSKTESRRQPFFSPVDTARLGLVDDPSFVTETLANIYEAQGYLEKARKAYELLSLKYPEKRNTFAARIEGLENRLKKEE